MQDTVNRIALLAILLLGGALRFYNLAHIPPLIAYDEAFYGAQAADSLRDHAFRISYYTDLDHYLSLQWQGGIFIWLVAGCFYLFGETLAALRSAPAFMGFLTLVGCCLLSLELWRHHPLRRWVALGSVFLLATSFWHVLFSRLAYSASIVPFFEVASLWLVLVAIRRPDLWISAAAGAVTAAGFYSYWGFYTFAILPVWLMLQHARRMPVGKRKLLAFMFMLLAFSMPLMLESLRADVFFRVRTLSVFHTARPVGGSLLSGYSAGLQHIALNVLSTLGMLVWSGSHDWKHNYNSAPELSLIAAVGFAMSCCYALSIWRRTRRGEHKPVTTHALRVLFVWVILAMLPGAMADEGVPHASRALGMVVPLQMLAGLGWSYIGQALVSSRFARAGRRYVAVACMAVFMMVQVYDVTYTYFVLYANAPETVKAFTANVTWCRTYRFCH